MKRNYCELMRSICTVLLLFLLMMTLSACNRGDNSTAGRKAGLKVVTSLYPLYDFTRNIGKNRVEVILLMPPGIEPHSFEPKPADVVTLSNADLFIFTNKYMEPWAEKLIGGVGSKKLVIVDSSKGVLFIEEDGEQEHHPEKEVHKEHLHKGMDPHIWLDLGNAVKMVDNITEGLIAKDTANMDYYRRNADEYKALLQQLDENFRKELTNCATRKIVSGGHLAFSYLAKRYSLTNISAYGFSPDAEPAPGQLIMLSKLLKKEGIKYIFYEEMLSPRVAELLSKESGAHMLFLNGIHNISRDEFEKGISFVTIMEKNLQNLKRGLQCREK
jgi:zinc transport system substrate-binding protein